MKSEPDVFSIDHLRDRGQAEWDGVRNFQARNFMKNDMKINDFVLFYHSSTNPPGVAGLARVSSPAIPDPTSWDPKSDYFDPRSKPDKPMWFMVHVEYVEKAPHFVTLDEIKGNPRLQDMMVIRRSMRLSIQPVKSSHFQEIMRLGQFKTNP